VQKQDLDDSEYVCVLGLAALCLLGKEKLCNTENLLLWTANRQMRLEGGFQVVAGPTVVLAKIGIKSQYRLWSKINFFPFSFEIFSLSLDMLIFAHQASVLRLIISPILLFCLFAVDFSFFLFLSFLSDSISLPPFCSSFF
jgi:hypothetical protein